MPPSSLFLEPQLDHQMTVLIAGKLCSVRSNSAVLIESLRKTYQASAIAGTLPDFTCEIRVDEVDETREWDTPCFRGMEHLVFATFGPRTFFTYDLLRKHVSAAIPRRRIGDNLFWKRVIVPITIGLLGPSIGLAPLHCACLVTHGDGILITGASGAGKSTLSVALSRCGFHLLSDDWTYLARTGKGLAAYGLGAPVKLLPDSVRFFPELESHAPAPALNGELAYEVDPQQVFQTTQPTECVPKRLFLLQRTEAKVCSFRSLRKTEVQSWLEKSSERLPNRLQSARNIRSSIIQEVATLDTFVFETGLSPRESAETLRSFCEST